MEFLKDYKELEGKTIKFAHLVNSEHLLLITNDNEILVLDVIDDYEIEIMDKIHAEQLILKNKYVRAELVSFKILTTKEIEEYEKNKAEEKRLRDLRIEEKRKAEEKREYLRLKAIYDPEV